MPCHFIADGVRSYDRLADGVRSYDLSRAIPGNPGQELFEFRDAGTALGATAQGLAERLYRVAPGSDGGGYLVFTHLPAAADHAADIFP